jgi:hypothetical protein
MLDVAASVVSKDGRDLDEDGRPRGDLPARMVRAYRATGAPFEAADRGVFRAPVDAMLNWAYLLCEIAFGGRVDPRSPEWAAARLRDSVLAWAPRWQRLDEVLGQLRTA